MQIKKRFQINVAVSVITAVVIGLVLFLALDQVKHTVQELEISGEILSSAFDRSALRDDYLRNNSERAKVQWFVRHEQIGTLLKAAAEKFKDAEDKAVIDKMIKDQESTGKLFSAVVENREKAKSGEKSIALSRETENRLISQLEMRLYDKVLYVRTLREVAQKHLFSSLRLAGCGIIILITIAAAAAIINSWIMGRTMTHRIERLQDGASIIGAGNLDHRIDITGNDEFADLSKAFNAMTEKVQASYRDLEGEIAARRMMEDALKQSERELETIIENAPACVKLVAEDGTLLKMNRAGLKIIEADGPGQVQGKSIYPLVSSLYRSAFINLTKKVFRGGAGTLEFEAVGLKGKKLWLNTHGVPLYDNAGEITALLGITVDVTDRKKAEEILRESENRLKRSQEIAHLGSWELDVVNNVLTWSDEVYRIFGLQPREFDATYEAFLEAVHPDDRAAVDEAYSGSLRDGRNTYEIEHRVVRKSTGEIRYVHEKCEHARDETDRIIRSAGMVQDITERKRAEEALRKSEERYRGLFENMIEGYAYCKMIFENGKPKDFIYLSVNHAFETLTGLKNVAGKRVTEVIPGIREADLELFEIYGRVSLTGKPERFEMFVETLKMWFSILVYSPEKEFFVAVFDVITERKRAEEALRDSEQRLRFHVENSPMAVVEWDADFNVTRWAGEAEKMFGWSAAETVGKLIMDLRMIYEDDIPIVNRTMERLTSGKERTVVSSNRNYTKSGAVIECVWYNSILLDAKGQMVSVLSLVQDITERKRAEEERERLLADLARSNRELEQFAYVASHDLQEPLRMVASYVQLLEEKYKGRLDGKADKYIHYAVDGAERMQKLIEGLLAYSRIARRGAEFGPVELNKVFSLAVSNLTTSIQESKTAITRDELPTLPGDETQLIQLFQNLIGNSVKYRKPDTPPLVHVAAKREGRAWVFSIRDNGIGIEPEHFDRIFQIFQRLHTRGEYSGTGIGLALCKRIVERHHGRIWVESIPGEGATFYFTLPERKM